MTTPRNPTYQRRKHMRLMAEEQQRAFNAHQRRQAAELAAAANQMADRFIQQAAADEARQLGQLLTH